MVPNVKDVAIVNIPDPKFGVGDTAYVVQNSLEIVECNIIRCTYDLEDCVWYFIDDRKGQGVRQQKLSSYRPKKRQSMWQMICSADMSGKRIKMKKIIHLSIDVPAGVNYIRVASDGSATGYAESDGGNSISLRVEPKLYKIDRSPNTRGLGSRQKRFLEYFYNTGFMDEVLKHKPYSYWSDRKIEEMLLGLLRRGLIKREDFPDEYK